MKNIGENKSSYHKLYLIDSEMYNRILPHLNEVDKQELNDTNEKNRSFEENKKEETFEQKNEDIEKMNEGIKQVNNAPDPAPKVEEPNIDNPTISVVEKTPEKTSLDPQGWGAVRVLNKKFACEICVDKKFTTKQSLKRHNKTFHRKKHSIKETQVNTEVIHPNTSLLETEGKASFVEEPKSKNLKRKFQHNPDEFHLIRDNLAFSKDEPVIKLPKHKEFTNIGEQRGVNSKVPKRAKVKRKFNDNADDFERDERRADEPVVKLPKYKWQSYSQ